MKRAMRSAAVLGVVAAGAFMVGCGGTSSSCASETPQLGPAPSCGSMMANAAVQVNLHICPTCNQTDAACQVDLSAVSSGIIHLDPVVHACEDSSSCPPSCTTSGVTCSFTTPDAGTYNLYIGDSTTAVPFTVAGGGNTTCG